MKKNWKRVTILTILLICIIISIVHCNNRLAENHKTELIRNLRTVTNQSVITIERELRAQQESILSMSAEIGAAIDHGESMEEIMERLSSMNKVSGFKRIGFVDENGMATTTDGYHQDMSYRESFQRSMQGEFVVTDTLMDTLGEEEPINAFNAPVYREDGSICGVIFATYRNEEFQKLFDMDSFEDTGSNCIVNADSEVIAATENLPFDPEQYTLWSYIESLGTEAQKMMEDYYQWESDKDELYFYIDGGENDDYYIYFEPIDMGDIDESWYVVTMVTTETLKKELSQTMRTVTVMLLEISLFVAAAYLFFAYDTSVSERRQRKELEQLAYVDNLTGGDNYACFKEKVTKQNRSGYMLSMDIRSFKMINSVCGAEKGDEILARIYEWIRDVIAPEDLVAHVSADRFVMFFPQQERKAVEEKLAGINFRIAEEMKKMDVPQVSAYYGIAKYERDASFEKVFSDANFARDSIHDKKDAIYSFFDQSATELILEDKKIEDSFENAIENHEFEVWYQPKFSPDTRTIVGAEALVRWRRQDGSLVSPGKFIPIFEGNGMIRTLDEYVFREVCREQKKLKDSGYAVFPISVNLSRASLYAVNLVRHYKEITDEIGVDSKMVPIEITESATIDDDSVRELADEFYQTGFPLQMDDFGSGYSSLASLNRMHFDVLKLDKSLIDYIGNFGGDQLIKHIIALAKDLGIHVTAEGVESENQVEFLQEQRCDSIQGFYFSKPVPQQEFEHMLEK